MQPGLPAQNGSGPGFERPSMDKIALLLEHIAAQNEAIIQQNEKILVLLSLHVVEGLPKPEVSRKPKSN